MRRRVDVVFYIHHGPARWSATRWSDEARSVSSAPAIANQLASTQPTANLYKQVDLHKKNSTFEHGCTDSPPVPVCETAHEHIRRPPQDRYQCLPARQPGALQWRTQGIRLVQRDPLAVFPVRASLPGGWYWPGHPSRSD